MGQNPLLAASELHLSALVTGSYFDAELERWLRLDGRSEVVLSVILVAMNTLGKDC